MKNPLNPSAWAVAIDAGNTFIDVCMFREISGQLHSVKVPCCPPGLSENLVEALDGLCQKAGVSPDSLSYIIHGNTLALNQLTWNRGSRTALLVTRGFRDIISLGKRGMARTDPPARVNERPVEPGFIFEVSERMLPGGQVFLPLDENEIIHKMIPLLKKNQVDSVAVCFLHSPDNPLHEKRVKEIIEQILPLVSVTVSHDISPFPGEYTRAMTAVANAAVSPLAGKCIEKELQSLSAWSRHTAGLWAMQSDTSVMTSRKAARESIRTVLSSPAGGIKACQLLARHTGRPNIITMEMGGAHSFFSILCQNAFTVLQGGSMAGYTLGFPMMDIHTCPIGGSSTALVDDHGHLGLGIENTGSVSGPACFVRGGQLPTCTDANLILGRLGAGSTLSGSIQPDLEAARTAVRRSIAGPLDISLERASQAVIKEANSIMAGAVRRMSAAKGCDPGEFTLISYGGCGPLHAAEVALELGIPHVLVPIYPGFHSALGMLFADLRREYSYKFSCILTEIPPDILDEKYKCLEEKARAEFGGEGLSENIIITRSADIKYKGQSTVINMQVPSGKLLAADLTLLKRAFDVTYNNESGLSPDGSEVEIVNLRLLAAAGIKGREGLFHDRGSINKTPVPRAPQNRPVVFGNSSINTPVYNRKDLPPNTLITGPAVVEQYDSTTVIWPGMKASVDKYRNIIIDVGVK